MKTQTVLTEYQIVSVSVKTTAIQIDRDQYHNSQSVMTLKFTGKMIINHFLYFLLGFNREKTKLGLSRHGRSFIN